MGEWLAKRGTRFVDALVVSGGIIVGLLGANLARVERAERRAAETLGPVDWNATAYPTEDAADATR